MACGAARSHARGITAATASGLKLKKAAVTTPAFTAPMGAARPAK